MLEISVCSVEEYFCPWCSYDTLISQTVKAWDEEFAETSLYELIALSGELVQGGTYKVRGMLWYCWVFLGSSAIY